MLGMVLVHPAEWYHFLLVPDLDSDSQFPPPSERTECQEKA